MRKPRSTDDELEKNEPEFAALSYIWGLAKLASNV